MSEIRQKRTENLDKLLASLGKKDLIEISKNLIIGIKERVKEKIELKEIYDMIREEEIDTLPVSVFNKELSVLESVIKYLKENKKLRYKEIAVLLNRDERNIWTAYKNASKKKREKLTVKKSEFNVPIEIFQDRKFSTLEVLTKYLKENKRLTYHNIAKLLHRNDRTIWTVYYRVKKKLLACQEPPG